jgi:TP901 family phage tail tape measure protein
MSGIANWQAQIRIDIEDLKKRIKVAEGEINNFTNEDRKLKLDIDTKTLESAIQKLDKMLDSLGKGTGDFKQFENLSKELSSVVSEVQSLSKAFGKVDDSGVKTLLSSIQNIDKSLAELNQNILNVNKNMSNMGGNTSGAVKQVENISNTYQNAAKEAEKLADAQSKIGQKTNISSASTESATNSIKEENNVLEQNTQKVKENTQAKEQNANANLNKYDKRLDSYNGKVDKYQATIDRFNDGGWTSKTYLENVQAVRDAVKQYATLLNNIKTNQNGIATDEDIQNLDKYEKKIKDTIATVTNMSAAEKGYSQLAGQKEIDKINKILRENSAMSSEAKAKIKAYKQELISGNPSVSLEKIHGEILKIVNAEELAGRAGRSFFDTLKNSGFHQLAAQMAGMFGFYDVINLGKEGFNVVRELNTALTEMRKVSNETVQSLKNYQATTFDTADAVGTTAKQIQNSTADWMRLGESMNQAAESAKDANVLLNVSEFEGIDEATESLVSMSQAYKDLDKMDIIDVLNNIGNNYSISTDGLATALKDSASALVTANNDLNEAVSLTTAGNAITQDPSKVGAGLRTISLRLVGTEEAKEELSDLGEETDGMITTVSKLRDTIMDATKAASSDGKGFDILDSNGNYKSTYEIMQGLADLYDDIVKKDKELGTNNLNLLLETIAGKNRSNIAASILQNGDMLRSVYEDAQNSEGSAEKELNSYLDSIDGKMAQLENRAQEFWFKVIDSETIKNGIDLLSTLLKGATDFVDTVGLLPTIFTGIGAALSFKNVGIDTLVAY